MRLGCVQAHSHTHCARGKERTLSIDGRGKGIRRTLESGEETIALGIDLVSAMGLQRFTQETTVLGAEVAIRGTVPARKCRRSLDVAEEERHCPARSTSIHTLRC
jgi:hypothetical protein